MRGGALPVIVWAALLALLLAGNWVWTGDAIQIAEFALAVLLVSASALALAIAHRGAMRRGSPGLRTRVQTVPDLCLGALLAPVGIASTLFGVAFGHFAIYFGIALLVLACGRVANELRAERRERRRLEGLRR